MDARSITTGHAHVRKPPASVCMVGHGRTFGLPAVHDSIANLLTVLKKHFVLHLAVVLLLTDSDSQPTFGQQIYGSTTCDGLQEGIKRLAPSILHLVNESSCAAFASMIGNRNAARASTRCQPNTLRMAWLQYCFESSPRASLYVRLRPDAFFAEPMSQLQSWRDLARTSEEAVASWVNTDCAGSDQVYAFNAPAYNGWWQRANREWWTSTMSHSRNTNFGGYPGSPEVSGAELNRVWTLMTVCPCLCAQFLLYGKARHSTGGVTQVHQDASLQGCIARSPKMLSCWSRRPDALRVLDAYRNASMASRRVACFGPNPCKDWRRCYTWG